MRCWLRQHELVADLGRCQQTLQIKQLIGTVGDTRGDWRGRAGGVRPGRKYLVFWRNLVLGKFRQKRNQRFVRFGVEDGLEIKKIYLGKIFWRYFRPESDIKGDVFFWQKCWRDFTFSLSLTYGLIPGEKTWRLEKQEFFQIEWDGNFLSSKNKYQKITSKPLKPNLELLS